MSESLEFAKYLLTLVRNDYKKIASLSNPNESLLNKKKRYVKRMYNKYVNELTSHVLLPQIKVEMINEIGKIKLVEFKKTYERNKDDQSLLLFGVVFKKRLKKVTNMDIDDFILDKIWKDVAYKISIYASYDENSIITNTYPIELEETRRNTIH